MKFLCVCEMGTVRSGAMAIALKMRQQSDVIQCGWRSGSPETLRMLCNWADAIVVMQREIIDLLVEKVALPEKEYKLDTRKILLVDVGVDIYGHPMHGGLLGYVSSVADQWKSLGFRLKSALGHDLPL